VKALKYQVTELRNLMAKTPQTIVATNNLVANPVRQALTQQVATLRAQIASDEAQVNALNAQKSIAIPAIRELPKRTATLLNLKRTAKQDEDVYNALSQKYNEARIAQTTALSDVSVIARANPNEAEVHPKLLINLAVGFLLALFLGIVGVFAAERLDRTVKTEEDVVQRLALPVLTSIPQLPARGSGPKWLQVATIDSFLQLVTSLRYASSERLATIAFTSGDARDGKSLVALRTAIAIAELEPRVLIIDSDLRLPSLHTKLEFPLEPGLSDVLVGTVSFEDALRPTPHAGLDVVTAGTPVPNAFALLQSAAFERFLREARSRYHTVIVDTPACGAVVDAAVVCGRVDGTVYVVAAQQTDVELADRGLTRLRAAGVRNVVGAVLNKVPPRRNTIGAYGEMVHGIRAIPLPPHARDGAAEVD
jgi:capsular exopolysaccharide synthesis family protein